jgi:hypothetical protein
MTNAQQPTASLDANPATVVWTGQRIRDLGTITDLRTAASIFGISRTVAYELARTDRFPVPLIRAGGRYKVPVAAILTILHVHPDIASTDDLIPRPNGAWINVTRSEAAPTADNTVRGSTRRSRPR